MIMKTLVKLITVLVPAGLIFTSCEGPRGLSGVDANETCKECHNSAVVEQKAAEFDFSKHKFGEAAFEEAGNVTCTPCHTAQAFKYVAKNHIPATFTLNTTTGKYSNDYVTVASAAFGELNCFTCHDNLHSTYTSADFKPLTTTSPVAMTMWKGAKTINLVQDDSISNLCVRCHQPRPLTTSSTLSNGDVVDYVALAANPTATFYDAAVGNAAPNKVIPSYRTHVHYGTVGAVFAGQGGVEFTGTQTYSSSAHTTVASCSDCHQAPVSGRAGGHTFYAAGNFNGCNTTGCHTGVDSKSTTFWLNPRTEIKGLLNSIAAKINAVGGATPILHTQTDPESNLWATLTTNSYDGYLNIYDPSTNPTGAWRNPAPSGSWTTAQKATNTALPAFPTLKNVTMGAMINFQFTLREFSLGIHNYKYTKALLQNSIEALTAAGY
jgi:hypothetical protein